MNFRERIAQIVFDEYVSGFVLDVQPMDADDEGRSTLIEGAKLYRTGAVKAVHDRIVKMILDDCLRKIGFKAKDEREALYWRGIARGIQLYEEHLNLYGSLTKKVKKNESTD